MSPIQEEIFTFIEPAGVAYRRVFVAVSGKDALGYYAGCAQCSPEDRFEPSQGARIALARALEAQRRGEAGEAITFGPGYVAVPVGLGVASRRRVARYLLNYLIETQMFSRQSVFRPPHARQVRKLARRLSGTLREEAELIEKLGSEIKPSGPPGLVKELEATGRRVGLVLESCRRLESVAKE